MGNPPGHFEPRQSIASMLGYASDKSHEENVIIEVISSYTMPGLWHGSGIEVKLSRQAIIREHLTKRGMLKTLQNFNEEKVELTYIIKVPGELHVQL